MYKSYFKENKDIVYYSKKAKLCNVLAEGLYNIEKGLYKLNKNLYSLSTEELSNFLNKNKIMSKKITKYLPGGNDLNYTFEYLLDNKLKRYELRQKLLEMKKKLYENKENFLKGIIPKELHEIRNRYYFYYVIGKYDFHAPIDWLYSYDDNLENNYYLLGQDFHNLSKYDLRAKVPWEYKIPFKEIKDMKPDNWDSNKVLAKKMISDLKKEFPIFKDLSIPFLVDCYNLKYRN
jgi:hypothetical protein